MRRLEAALTDEPQVIRDLAVEILGANGRAQVESTRRAAKRLAELGRAHVARFQYVADQGHGALRSVLTVRRAVTDADHRAADWVCTPTPAAPDATPEDPLAVLYPDHPLHASVFGDGADPFRVQWLVYERAYENARAEARRAPAAP